MRYRKIMKKVVSLLLSVSMLLSGMTYHGMGHRKGVSFEYSAYEVRS